MGKYKPVERKFFDIQKEERLGEERINNQGLWMKIIAYRKYTDIDVLFENGTVINSNYYAFTHGSTHRDDYFAECKIGEAIINNQGYEMKIAEYINSNDIWAEFQDDYKSLVHCSYSEFKEGKVHNPCTPGKYGNITGNKYPTKINGIRLKEYDTWIGLFHRINDILKQRNRTYENVTICDEWYYYPNFYEWIIKQPNYNLWKKSEKDWAIDKDILSDPNNKIYSPDTCCLVPRYINDVIRKRTNKNDDLPNGVSKNGKGYAVRHVLSGSTYFTDLDEAIKAYKKYKKDRIIKTAQQAYNNKEITEKCYYGLLNYTNF